MDNHVKKLLTRKEAAGFLRISTATLDRYIKTGDIVPIKIGRRYRFPEDVLSVVTKKEQSK